MLEGKSMADDEKKIYRLIGQGGIEELSSFLDSSGIDLINIRFQQGFTPLHFAAFKNSYYATTILCRHVHEFELTRNVESSERGGESEASDRASKIVREWVNLPTEGEEGFRALHFAAFNGNLQII